MEDNGCNASDSGLHCNKLGLPEMQPGAAIFYNKNLHVVKVLT
jgi:hypothetical protein